MIFAQEMYFAEREMFAQARTSNLHEDLGQIDYIFSDKTGTLTRNEMLFLKCSTGETAWHVRAMGGSAGPGTPERELSYSVLSQLAVSAAAAGEPVVQVQEASKAHEFFRALALCHTVVVEEEEQEQEEEGGARLKYQAESPDEEALVAGAAQLGYVFTAQSTVALSTAAGSEGDGGATVERYHIRIRDGAEEIYEVHGVNAFTSTRKRMSIVVRAPDGRYILYAKGADMMMTADCGVAIPTAAQRHLQAFAVEGLRTLVVGRKVLSHAQFRAWQAGRAAAQRDINNRAALLAAVAAKVEGGESGAMEYVGVTAIEDKLQEGVPEAIERLRQADLKIWVLTGDKEETAINVGKACRLLDGGMDLHVIRGSDPDGGRNPARSTQQPRLMQVLYCITQCQGSVVCTEFCVMGHTAGGSDGVYSLAHISKMIGDTYRAAHTAQEQGRQLGLVVDGQALGEIFREYRPSTDASYTEEEFGLQQLQAQQALVQAGHECCAAVIGCRVSPKQKRDIVLLVKTHSIGGAPMTLAIGDGANDVSMIQEVMSHVDEHLPY